MKIHNKDDILNAIKTVAEKIGKSPSRSEFVATSGIREYYVLKYFPNWNSAVKAAGLEPDTSNIRIQNEDLLKDWGAVVRELRQIPTRTQYQHRGKYSTGSFEKHFGPWSKIPESFREFASNKSEWNDVLTLLPISKVPSNSYINKNGATSHFDDSNKNTLKVHNKLSDRAIYGSPIDFRGLRHEPVNENGVIFLFGIVARELGYSVESVQSGFPDCEAKRQISADKWQRVRIEFEYESRNFRDHGHSADQCDVIVCWRHNWSECPQNIEVVELKKVIRQLAKSDDLE